MSKRSFLILLSACVAVALVYASLRQQAMLAAAFTTLEHGVVTRDALRGKVVMVNFWATTCDICLKEMPRLVDTHRRFEARGLETIAVAMPYDPPNLVVDYAQRARLPFKVAIDPNGEVARGFGDVRFTPTTFVLDRSGRVVKRYVGEPDFAELERVLEATLATPS